jgi:hypothetical protein
MIERLAVMEPADIYVALNCMREGLEYFHARNDFRAVFLRAYYIITKNVGTIIRAQIEGEAGIFLDPEWMSKLAGKFATLYFRSLNTFERPAGRELAWKLTHGLALERRSTVVQDLLLGINAHVNYDLAFALHANVIEHDDHTSPERLAIRKADHFRANAVLMRSINEIWSVIPREYGGELGFVDRVTVLLDRPLAMFALMHYRARVWERALLLLNSKTSQDMESVVSTLNSESMAVAERIAARPLFMFDAVRRVTVLNRRQSYESLSLEEQAVDYGQFVGNAPTSLSSDSE